MNNAIDNAIPMTSQRRSSGKTLAQGGRLATIKPQL